ncbi:MAG: hypothetical protein WCA56_20815 [Xanthobacteraceae bacterium]|jgi:hypothetical protein
MAKSLSVRLAGALGVTSLAFLIVGLIPFLGAAPSAGAGYDAPAFTVNREFKGDRLPVGPDINAAFSRAVTRSQQRSQGPQGPQEMPIGCDPAFSPVTNPKLAYYYGRCTT